MKTIFFSGVLLLSTVLGSNAFAESKVKFTVVCAGTGNSDVAKTTDWVAKSLTLQIDQIKNVLDVSSPGGAPISYGYSSNPLVCVTVKSQAE